MKSNFEDIMGLQIDGWAGSLPLKKRSSGSDVACSMGSQDIIHRRSKLVSYAPISDPTCLLPREFVASVFERFESSFYALTESYQPQFSNNFSNHLNMPRGLAFSSGVCSLVNTAVTAIAHSINPSTNLLLQQYSEKLPMSASANLDLTAKLLNKAGHPGTPDTEALTFVRKAYALVDAAGTDFAAMLKASAPQTSQREIELHDTISQLRRELSTERNRHWRAADRIEAGDKKIKELNAKLREARRENTELRAELKETEDFASAAVEQNAELGAEIQGATRVNREQAARIEALQAENTALNAAMYCAEIVQASRDREEHEPTTWPDKLFETGSATQSTGSEVTSALDVQRLIAALDVLRKIDPDMRIKTALAYLHTVTSDGLTIADTASLVDQASVGSIRYAMRTLGQGWPGKRVGLGLVQDCADADGGRARLYVASARGRKILHDITTAIQTISAQGAEQPDLKLAA